MQTYAFTNWNYFQGQEMQKKSYEEAITQNNDDSHYFEKIWTVIKPKNSPLVNILLFTPLSLVIIKSNYHIMDHVQPLLTAHILEFVRILEQPLAAIVINGKSQ